MKNTKYVVVETMANCKDKVLATCDSLPDAMLEQKRKRKTIAEDSVIGIQEKSIYDFIQAHNKRKKSN